MSKREKGGEKGEGVAETEPRKIDPRGDRTILGLVSAGGPRPTPAMPLALSIGVAESSPYMLGWRLNAASIW